MKTLSLKTALATVGLLLATVTAPAAVAAPQYIKLDGINGETKQGKPGNQSSRPNVAAGDVNGDGYADRASQRSATLSTRKAGEGQGAQTKSKSKAPPTNTQTGLLLPAVQKPR